MTLSELNPYVRFARRQERKFAEEERVAADHRLFIVESGSARFYLKGQLYTLEANDVIFWRAGIPYRVEAEADTVISGCNFDFVHTHRTVLHPVFPVSADTPGIAVLEPDTFTDTEFLQDVCLIRNAHGVRHRLHTLYEEYESKQIFYEQRCSALMKEVLTLCLRLAGGNQAASSAQITQQILAYIRQHYSKQLTNEHFSQVFHYHPNYISQLVKEQTGLPLHRYIRTYRIYQALELLQTTELSVTQVAEAVGMPDIQQFSKAFKQIVGVSPGTFLK